MKRKIIQTKKFTKTLISFITKKKLEESDFTEFKKNLILNPELGELITGTGGVRKVRLKSVGQGKSGGFRICYFNDLRNNAIFFLLIYSKNAKADLSMDEKKELKEITTLIKREKND